jgi:hypothetical protein
MRSLEEVFNNNAKTPAILSTAGDISAAFHIAVNDSEIDWPFAEKVLERFLFLCTEEQATVNNDMINGINDAFRKAIICSHNF